MAVLIALSHSLVSNVPVLLVMVSASVLGSYRWLLQSRSIWQRLLLAAASWCGLLLLGLLPGVERLSNQPWTPLFWQSHFWMGLLLSGLLLSSTGLQPLIDKGQANRQLHIGTNLVVTLLLAMQAISGTRNLTLEDMFGT